MVWGRLPPAVPAGTGTMCCGKLTTGDANKPDDGLCKSREATLLEQLEVGDRYVALGEGGNGGPLRWMGQGNSPEAALQDAKDQLRTFHQAHGCDSVPFAAFGPFRGKVVLVRVEASYDVGVDVQETRAVAVGVTPRRHPA